MRLPSSRFRSGSTRSASTSSPGTTPRSNEANWPTGLLNSQGSPSTDGANPAGSPSVGSRHVSSSDDEHSPSQGTENQPHEEHEWHDAFFQEDNEPGDTEESMNNGGHLVEIPFNSFGQPVDKISKPYASRIGVICRNVVSPHHADWRIVPVEDKEEIWRTLNNEYKIPEIIKAKVLKMANKSWKNRKNKLREWCDKFDTIAAKKQNRPAGVRKENWERFVDLCATDKDKKLRQIGKESRKQLRALHTTGRDGIARRRHIMEQQSPTGSVMDPNCYEVKCREYVAKIRELNETEQYRNETNLDKDAVAAVLRTDGRGFVREMGGGVSKTEVRASAIPREQLRQQVMKTRAVEERVRTLEVTVETLMAGLSCNAGTSNANAQGMNAGGCHPNSQRVILRNMRKRCVALGLIDRTAPLINDECRLVQIEEVCLEYEGLYDCDGTFKDINKGEKILWPHQFVCPIGGDGF